MQSIKESRSYRIQPENVYDIDEIHSLVTTAFNKIAPAWPLKNIIAVNPLQGFEDLPFEEAMLTAATHFQGDELPASVHAINRESIKWCQAYFDEGQASIPLPCKEKGLYQCFKLMAQHDTHLTRARKGMRNFLESLPASAEEAIALCLHRLSITKSASERFTFFLLSSLPGWSSYIYYLAKWKDTSVNEMSALTTDFIAMRVILTYIIYPSSEALQQCYQGSHDANVISSVMQTIASNESKYEAWLFKQLSTQKPTQTLSQPAAQFVFCIDVRSEPLRRALESTGAYQTLGFAGFFGIPTVIENTILEDSHASCPVLVKPKHIIKEQLVTDKHEGTKILRRRNLSLAINHLYRSLKYTFTTPLILAESIGLWSGLWMMMKSLAPNLAAATKMRCLQLPGDQLPLKPVHDSHNGIAGLTIDEQTAYAHSFLMMTGLTKSFAPIIVLCAHGAATENNAYHSALNCGACGGYSGAPNARILATILNNRAVRKSLAAKGLDIPDATHFIAGQHNTTTDEVTLFLTDALNGTEALSTLQNDLQLAKLKCNRERSHHLALKSANCPRKIAKRSLDWSEVRPEWGLAKNAAFIVGPRQLTQAINLEGRAFLHSYDWKIDTDGALLTTILTAPMIVAQWINCQYLFSTLDNVAYGGGSKVTQNITGKLGIMQGNASDLMHGLPLQSVYRNDKVAHHEMVRLLTVIHAPKTMIENIIAAQPILQKLVSNSWVRIACLNPDDMNIYLLQSDFTWAAHQPE